MWNVQNVISYIRFNDDFDVVYLNSSNYFTHITEHGI